MLAVLNRLAVRRKVLIPMLAHAKAAVILITPTTTMSTTTVVKHQLKRLLLRISVIMDGYRRDEAQIEGMRLHGRELAATL